MGSVRKEDLTDAEFASLKEVGSSIARDVIPEDHRKRLIELRLIKDELGTLRQTPHGVFITRAVTDPLASLPRWRRDR